MNKVFSHPSIARRHFAFDVPDDLVDEHPDHRIARFTHWAVELSQMAAVDALRRAELTVEDVSGLVVNTCTGYICPGLSTYLIERMGLRKDITAVDLVGNGCGAAIPNVQICQALLKENLDGVILCVSAEICSSTFQMGDELSLIVSNALFADGAGACVLWNRPRGLGLVGWASRHAPEFREDIRYVHRNGQLFNQLSPKLPELAGKLVAQVVTQFLRSRNMEPRNIRHWAIHPGGESILNAIKKELGLSDEQLAHSRQVLAQYGNISSSTVWFVLRDILETGTEPGDWCLMVAFGAGLSVHVLLLQT